MGINIGVIITAVTGSVISAALVAIAVCLNRLIVQVALLNQQFSRVEMDIAALTKRLDRIYEEHVACDHCGNNPAR